MPSSFAGYIDADTFDDCMSGSVSDQTSSELTALQRRIVDTRSRVLLVMEGRSGRVIGRVANELMNLLEPRGTKYTHFIPTKSKTSPKDIMGYLAHEPSDGSIAIYDRSWYSPMMLVHLDGGDTSEFQRNSVSFERYLVNNGTIVVKVFLDIKDEDIEETGRRFGSKRVKNETFLTDDHIGTSNFDRKFFKKVMMETSTDYAPWDLIDAEEIGETMELLSRIFIDRVTARLEEPYSMEPMVVTAMFPNPRDHADMTQRAKGYKDRLEELSSKLYVLQNRLAASERSLVLVFEGWDAAGKGGSIKRVTRALNPRGYRAVPIAAPVGDERVHTYLWRFSESMPDRGHIVIFDRSWYGRMMVEPIEGFCTEEEYGRSALEICGFERTIVSSGCIMIKFWMEVSPEEQLRRFNDRQENPLKQWKITDEDWRNRSKWDTYSEYIDRMISSTNMLCAPWVVIESEDKKYGRLKVLSTIVETLERELE